MDKSKKTNVDWSTPYDDWLIRILNRFRYGGAIECRAIPSEIQIHIDKLIAQETKKAEVKGQLMAINYALSKSQVFTYARSIGEIRAGEESGAIPISELDKRKRELEAELQAGSE